MLQVICQKELNQKSVQEISLTKIIYKPQVQFDMSVPLLAQWLQF